MHPVYSQVLEYIKNGDQEGLKQYLNTQMDLRDLLTVKCETCGEILVVRPLSVSLPMAFSGGDLLIGYATLKHLQFNRHHKVVLNGWPGDLDLSKMYLGILSTSCKKHNITLEEGFEKRLPYLKERIKNEPTFV